MLLQNLCDFTFCILSDFLTGGSTYSWGNSCPSGGSLEKLGGGPNGSSKEPFFVLCRTSWEDESCLDSNWCPPKAEGGLREVTSSHLNSISSFSNGSRSFAKSNCCLSDLEKSQSASMDYLYYSRKLTNLEATLLSSETGSNSILPSEALSLFVSQKLVKLDDSIELNGFSSLSSRRLMYTSAWKVILEMSFLF